MQLLYPRLANVLPGKLRQVWTSLAKPGYIQLAVMVLHATFIWKQKYLGYRLLPSSKFEDQRIVQSYWARAQFSL